MAARPVLIVVVVDDAEIRSMLAERLAMQGANLLTASSAHDGLFERAMIREPAILVIDEVAAAGEHRDWIERERLKGRWRRVLVLTADPPADSNDRGWLVSVHRHSADDLLAALFADWTQAHAA